MPILTCEDVREELPDLSRAGLTEWALVEAHRRECAECREAARLLQERAMLVPRIAPHRVLHGWVAERIQAIRSSCTGAATWAGRVVLSVRASLTAVRLEVMRATDKVTRVIHAGRVTAMRVVAQRPRVRVPNIHVRLPSIHVHLPNTRLPHIEERSARVASKLLVIPRVAATRLAGMLGRFGSATRTVAQTVGGVLPVQGAGSRAFGLLVEAGAFLPRLLSGAARVAGGLMGHVVETLAHQPARYRSFSGGVSRRVGEAAIEGWRYVTLVGGRLGANTSGAARSLVALARPGIAAGCARGCLGASLALRGVGAFAARSLQTANKASDIARAVARMVLEWSAGAVRGVSAAGLGGASGVAVAPVARLVDRSRFPRAMRWPLPVKRPIYMGLVSVGVLIMTALLVWPGGAALFSGRPTSGRPTLERLSRQEPQPTDSKPADRSAAQPRAAGQNSLRRNATTVATTQQAPVPRSGAQERPAAVPLPTRTPSTTTGREPASAVVTPAVGRPAARESARASPVGVGATESPDASEAIDWLLSKGRETSRRDTQGP